MLTYLVTILSVGWLSLKADKFRNAVQASFDDKSIALKGECKQGLWYFWLAVTILIFVSGFRFGVGADYFAYSYAFYLDDYKFVNRLVTFSEPAYTFLMIVSRWIYYDFATMTLLTALITIGLVFYIIQKYSEDYFLSIMLFILLGSWHFSFNAMRQGLAISILFAGHRYILERKTLCYLVIVIIASCFHTTALFMIPCYFLLNIKKIKFYILCLIIFGIIVYLANNQFLIIMTELKGVDQTVQSYALRSVNVLRTLVSFIPCCIFHFMSLENDKQSKQHLFYLKLTMLNAILLSATYKSAYLARISFYTDIFSTLSFPSLFKLFPVSTYKLLCKVTIGLYLIFWYVEVTRRETLLPFRWVFER